MKTTENFTEFLDLLDPEMYNKAIEKYAELYDLNKFSNALEDGEDCNDFIIEFKKIIVDLITEQESNLKDLKEYVIKDLNKITLQKYLPEVLKIVNYCVEYAEANLLTNEQFYLDFEDDLNYFSIKEH